MQVDVRKLQELFNNPVNKNIVAFLRNGKREYTISDLNSIAGQARLAGFPTVLGDVKRFFAEMDKLGLGEVFKNERGLSKFKWFASRRDILDAYNNSGPLCAKKNSEPVSLLMEVNTNSVEETEYEQQEKLASEVNTKKTDRVSYPFWTSSGEKIDLTLPKKMTIEDVQRLKNLVGSILTN